MNRMKIIMMLFIVLNVVGRLSVTALSSSSSSSSSSWFSTLQVFNSFPATMIGQRIAMGLVVQEWACAALNSSRSINTSSIASMLSFCSQFDASMFPNLALSSSLSSSSANAAAGVTLLHSLSSVSTDPSCTTTPTLQMFVDLMLGVSTSSDYSLWPEPSFSYPSTSTSSSSSSFSQFVNSLGESANTATPSFSSVLALFGIACTQALSSATQLQGMLSNLGFRGVVMLLTHMIPPASLLPVSQTATPTSTTVASTFSITPSMFNVAGAIVSLLKYFRWHIPNVALVLYDPFNGAYSNDFVNAYHSFDSSVSSSSTFAYILTPKVSDVYSTYYQQMKAANSRIIVFANQIFFDHGERFLLGAATAGLMQPGFVWVLTNPFLCSNFTFNSPLRSAFMNCTVFCPMFPDVPTAFAANFRRFRMLHPNSPSGISYNPKYDDDPRVWIQDYDMMQYYLHAVQTAIESNSVDFSPFVSQSSSATMSANAGNVSDRQLLSSNLISISQQLRYNSSSIYTPYYAATILPSNSSSSSASSFWLANPNNIVTFGLISPNDGLLHPTLAIRTDTFQIVTVGQPPSVSSSQLSKLTFNQGDPGSSSGAWIQPTFVGFAVGQIPADILVIVPPTVYVDYVLPVTMPLMFTVTAVVLVVIVLLMSALVIYFRHHAIVKASSVTFNLISLVGLLGLLGASFIFTLRPESDNVVCQLRPWFLLVSFQLFFCPLFARSFRVFRIFSHERQLKKLRLPDSVLLVDVSVVLAAHVVLLLIWSTLPSERPSITFNSSITELNDATAHTASLVHECTSSAVFVPLLLTLLGVELVSAFWLSFRIRHLKFDENYQRNFNESAYVLAVLCFLLAYLLLLLPLQWQVEDPSQLILLRSGGIQFGILVILIVLFVPKVYHCVIETQKSNKSSNNTMSHLPQSKLPRGEHRGSQKESQLHLSQLGHVPPHQLQQTVTGARSSIGSGSVIGGAGELDGVNVSPIAVSASASTANATARTAMRSSSPAASSSSSAAAAAAAAEPSSPFPNTPAHRSPGCYGDEEGGMVRPLFPAGHSSNRYSISSAAESTASKIFNASVLVTMGGGNRETVSPPAVANLNVPVRVALPSIEDHEDSTSAVQQQGVSPPPSGLAVSLMDEHTPTSINSAAARRQVRLHL